MLSDRPATYPTKFNGSKVIKYEVSNSFCIAPILAVSTFILLLCLSPLYWLNWNGCIVWYIEIEIYFIFMIFRSSDLNSCESCYNRPSWVTVDNSPCWCEVAHAPPEKSDITPAWRHCELFLTRRDEWGRRRCRCHNDLDEQEEIV